MRSGNNREHAPAQGSGVTGAANPLEWFADMVDRNYEAACAAKAEGRRLVGIMCEYTPRELILAAGALPACLCGGSAEMIPAAEAMLPSGLCPLVKSTFGYSLARANPFLEMADLVVAETTCDGKKKMFELMAARHPMVVLELPQKPDDADAFEHWVREIGKLKEELERRFAVSITDQKLRGGIATMNRERRLKRELAALMKSESPPVTGRELLDMKSIVACLPDDLEAYKRALKLLPGRVIDPPAVTRIRVLLTGVPLPHGAERVMDILEGRGGLVVCQENCTGLKPVLEDVDPDAPDLVRAIAAKYFHLPCSVMTPNRRRFEQLKALILEYRPQCVVELTWHGCLTYAVEAHQVQHLVREELGLPYLRIETDYSPSDSSRLALRVDALYETVRGG